MSMTSEQIQALKAAAENLKEIGIIHNYSKSVVAQIAFEKQVTPEAILSLLAERDADKALIAVYSDAYKEAAHEVSVNWEAATALAEENTELKRRIAELEAQKVSVKCPTRYDIASLFDVEPDQDGPLLQFVDVVKTLHSAGITLVVGE